MARKVKFDEAIILEKTKQFIEEFGIESMNARDLCKYIGCSTQPLFKNFKNMEEFKKILKDYLHNYYDEFINKYIDKEDYLYTISYAYCLFAKKNKNIFKALFMSDLAGTRTIDEVLNSSWNIDTINNICIKYSKSMGEARNIYRDVRFFTHGLSCQIAINSIKVTEREISNLILNNIDKNI